MLCPAHTSIHIHLAKPYSARARSPDQSGEFIGKINFFTDAAPKIYMKSLQLTHIISVKKADFLKLVKETPYDYVPLLPLVAPLPPPFVAPCCSLSPALLGAMSAASLTVSHRAREQESYRELMEKISRNEKILGGQCKSCQRITHETLKCPYLQYRCHKQLIIGRHNFSQPQERSHYYRLKRKKFQTLSDRTNIKDSLRECRVDLTEEVLQGVEDICDIALDEEYDHDFYLSLPTLVREGGRLIQVEDDP